MSANRVLFATGGVLVGLLIAKMLGVGGLTSRLGIAA